ncbi:hypothetical protein HPB49_018151 [Dermacentor silvarum]|uniref:Uncharacterized protein n=1 Tax=Dermacentor silvarum TaxID=543639 RepID=A0ACB8D725_DERSI|nr:hypothetical protein HPB49_018151 [Dermacentor silvarum]
MTVIGNSKHLTYFLCTYVTFLYSALEYTRYSHHLKAWYRGTLFEIRKSRDGARADTGLQKLLAVLVLLAATTRIAHFAETGLATFGRLLGVAGAGFARETSFARVGTLSGPSSAHSLGALAFPIFTGGNCPARRRRVAATNPRRTMRFAQPADAVPTVFDQAKLSQPPAPRSKAVKRRAEHDVQEALGVAEPEDDHAESSNQCDLSCQAVTTTQHSDVREAEPQMRDVYVETIPHAQKSKAVQTCIKKPSVVMGVQSLQKTQYFQYQRCYLLPAVEQSQQKSVIEETSHQPRSLAGDDRCDMPGNSADFGTYTLLETDLNKIMHTELVKQTVMAMKSCFWQDGCILCHIVNVHDHPDSLHPSCFHGEMPERDWLVEGSKSFERMKAILAAPHLLRDLPRASHRAQTFGLEAFHSMLIHFTPKSSKFTYEGMLARQASSFRSLGDTFVPAHSKLVKGAIAKNCIRSALDKSCEYEVRDSVDAQLRRVEKAGCHREIVASVVESQIC